MGEWSKLDRRIAEMDKKYKQELVEEADTLEEYFDGKNKERLKKTNINSMPWSDVHILNNIKKSADDEYKDPSVSNPKPEEQTMEILEVLSRCVEMAARNRPDLVPSLKKLAQLFEHQTGVQKGCVTSKIIKECTRSTDIKKPI